MRRRESILGLALLAIRPRERSRPWAACWGAHHGILDHIPLGRVGTVEEVALVIVFLAWPAAALVTGSRWRLDRLVSPCAGVI